MLLITLLPSAPLGEKGRRLSVPVAIQMIHVLIERNFCGNLQPPVIYGALKKALPMWCGRLTGARPG